MGDLGEGVRRGLGRGRAPTPSCNEDTEGEISQAPADLLCSTPGLPAARSIESARGAAGGTGPFSSGGCWNCNYREAVSGEELTWISTHVPCVFHVQTCGLYSTLSFTREWVKRGWKRLQAQLGETWISSFWRNRNSRVMLWDNSKEKIIFYFIHIYTHTYIFPNRMENVSL